MKKLMVVAAVLMLQLMLAPKAQSQQAPEPLYRASSHRLYNVPAEQLWKLISTSGYLIKIDSIMSKDSVLSWPGANSDEILFDYKGLPVERKFTSWTEGVGYEALIINLGKEKANDTLARMKWRIEKVSETKCKLVIGFRAVYPVSMSEEEKSHRFASNKLSIIQYCNSLLDGIAYYLSTGKGVKRRGGDGAAQPEAR